MQRYRQDLMCVGFVVLEARAVHRNADGVVRDREVISFLRRTAHLDAPCSWPCNNPGGVVARFFQGPLASSARLARRLPEEGLAHSADGDLHTLGVDLGLNSGPDHAGRLSPQFAAATSPNYSAYARHTIAQGRPHLIPRLRATASPACDLSRPFTRAP